MLCQTVKNIKTPSNLNLDYRSAFLYITWRKGMKKEEVEG